jgi:WD repeat-containing protein 61
VYVFNTETNQLEHTLPGHAMCVRSLTFLPDSKTLVTGSDDKCINVYDVEHGQLAFTLTGHSDWVLSVSANPDISKQQLASCGSDKRVKVWDLALKSVIETHEVHSDQVMSHFIHWSRQGYLCIEIGLGRGMECFWYKISCLFR